MAPDHEQTTDLGQDEFRQQARQRRSGGVIGEYIHLLRTTKKWWLTPIVLALLLVGFFVGLSGTAVAPLIYTLF
jgi:Family of unknown function (DUF5989)